MTTATEPVTQQPSPGTRWVRRILVAVITLALIGGAIATYWWAEVQTYHFGQISAGILYRDGNRGMREFRHALDLAHIKTVVSLIDDQELNDPKKPQFKEEAEYCQAHGIKQVRIPVKLGGWPTNAQVGQFLTIVQDPINRPVLVHCAQGVRRTGMFMAAYQLSVLDRSPAFAKATIQTFGHKDKDLDDVRTFIDGYDPTLQADPVTRPTTSPE